MPRNVVVVLLVAVGLVALYLTGRKVAPETFTEFETAVSDAITKLIAGEEGFSATPYLDPPGNTKGQYSIGYGHLIVEGDPYWPFGTVKEIDRATASAQLDQDTAVARDIVTRYVKVPLTENQFAALVSFVFNVANAPQDRHRFTESTLLRLLNAGDYQGAANQLDLWVNAGGVRSEALVTRRAFEKQTFLS